MTEQLLNEATRLCERLFVARNEAAKADQYMRARRIGEIRWKAERRWHRRFSALRAVQP